MKKAIFPRIVLVLLFVMPCLKAASQARSELNWSKFLSGCDLVIYYSAVYKGEERGFTWQWVPEESVSSRTKYSHIKVPDNYKGNPTGKLVKNGKIGVQDVITYSTNDNSFGKLAKKK